MSRPSRKSDAQDTSTLMRHRRSPTIVVVAHMCPFPMVHGNRRRFVSLLSWLKSHGFSVTFVLQPLDVDGPDGVADLRKVVDRLEIVPGPHAPSGLRAMAARLARRWLPRRLANGLRDLVTSTRPPTTDVKGVWGTGDVGGDGHIDGWCWPTTCQAVRRVVRRDRPVAVITEYALLSKCLEEVPSPILRVTDTTELFFRNPERFHVEGLTAPFVCTPESERAALDRADVLVAIQRNDAQALRELIPGKEIITAPHTYPEGRPRSGSPRAGTVLYVGSANPFNLHGLRQFLKDAWEPILTRVPDATLRVVGSVAATEDARSLGGRQVVYIGRVSDDELAHEYQTAHVVINPQVAGTGLKIKCVEALTSGCPLVMNAAGADGLEEGSGVAFLLAKDWPTSPSTWSEFSRIAT